MAKKVFAQVETRIHIYYTGALRGFAETLTIPTIEEALEAFKANCPNLIPTRYKVNKRGPGFGNDWKVTEEKDLVAAQPEAEQVQEPQGEIEPAQAPEVQEPEAQVELVQEAEAQPELEPVQEPVQEPAPEQHSGNGKKNRNR